MEALRRTDVYCPDCDTNGDHDDQCEVKDYFPGAVMSDNNNLVHSVVTSSGNVIKGLHNNRPDSFKCVDLPAFRHGRPLIKGSNGRHEWFRFDEELETSFQTRALQASTPMQTTRIEQPVFTSTPNPVHRSRSVNFAPEPTASTSNANVSVGNEGSRFSEADLSLTKTVIDGLREGQMSIQMIAAIPVFNGDGKNFDPWHQKVLQARKVVDDQTLLNFLPSKISDAPAQHLLSVGVDFSNLSRILNALREEYDELASGVTAQVKLQNLRQGNKTLSVHHTAVTRILRALGESLSTRLDSIRTNYAQSISNEGLRKRLVRTLIKAPSTTLGEMMKMSSDAAKVDKIHEYMSGGPPSSTCTVHAAGVQNAQPEQRPQHLSSRPGRMTAPAPTRAPHDEHWCDIHQAASHDTAECRLKNSTFCPFCKGYIEAGSMTDHIRLDRCQGRKCHECGKRGHIGRYCSKNKPGPGTRGGRGGKSGFTGSSQSHRYQSRPYGGQNGAQSNRRDEQQSRKRPADSVTQVAVTDVSMDTHDIETRLQEIANTESSSVQTD